MKSLPEKKNLSEWFTQVCLKTELADYAPVRGCMVIRPAGFAIWERIRDFLDREFRELGVRNAYFPIFIPESFLLKEKEHIEGFAPQCAWVERGGEEELEERLALRPTSEAIICSMFAKWVRSYRDLPVLVNQWVNVIRWEKTTRLFLRTTEFLWQEGHTLHRTEAEAEEFALKILAVYERLLGEFLAIPVLVGEKPESERFAGAKRTYTLEALMPDGQALQAGTSHNLGQNFSRAFEIRFLDSDNSEKYPFGTSWGVSTRIIGALVMVHGDDRGLVLPPGVSETKVVIVPILTKEAKLNESLLSKGREISDRLREKGISSYFDERTEFSPGWKFNEWEMRGVPLRIEIGEEEIKNKTLCVKKRTNEKRERVKEEEIGARCEVFLKEIQEEMKKKAREFLSERISRVESLAEAKRVLQEKPGFFLISLCGERECEDRVRQETKSSPRVIPDGGKRGGRCVVCGSEAKYEVYFARAY
jgi:prolyl-tRNA synthetase|uniref:Proline--tRNA ligase n=1 Tax=candidate division WOR-3 bacterium TaxID=2052148 RepID=A0A7C3Z3C2_UNCW3